MKSLDGATVAVTGAGGFVGAHLVRALAAKGARVHGLGAEAPRDDLPLAGWRAVDVRAPVEIAAALEALKPDAVVHLAGQASAGRSFEQSAETYHVNALGTWHVLEAVRLHAPRARVLAVGTGEAYGPQPEGSRAAESTPFRPVSPYAISKAAADAFADLAARTGGLDVVRTRSFAHAGPGQAVTFAIPSWASQIAAIEKTGKPGALKVGNLQVTRDLSDVRDVADAYVRLLERGRTGQAYNVCRGEGVRLADVARALAAQARVPVAIEPDRARMRPADVPYLVGDPAAIAADTGWKAAIPLERTLADVLEDWRAR